MISSAEILQTIQMFDQQHLDIRTITMGVSLLDCAHPDPRTACSRIYDKICRRAGHLVATGEAIGREFGIPIVNKRVSVTPISLVAAASETADYVPFAKALDKAAKTVGSTLSADSLLWSRKDLPPQTVSSLRPSPRLWPPPTWCALL